MAFAVPLQNFDAEGDTPTSRRPPPSRVYHEDEVREMVRGAFDKGQKEGRDLGRREAEAEKDAVRDTTLDTLAQQLDGLLAEAGAHRATLEAHVLEFALSVCDAVFPELVQKLSVERVSAQTRQALKMAIGSAHLTIRLSPQSCDALSGELTSRLRYYRMEQACRIETDASLAPGDVRMAWDSGTLDYAYRTVTERILKELRNTHAEALRKQEERSGYDR